MTLLKYSCIHLKYFRYQNTVHITFFPQTVTVYHNIFTDGLHTKSQIPDIHPVYFSCRAIIPHPTKLTHPDVKALVKR